jgi:alpha-L-fucosidase
MKALIFKIFILISFVSVAQNKESIGAVEADYIWWRKARFGVFIHWNMSSLLDLKAGSWDRKTKKIEKKKANNSTNFVKVPEFIEDNSYLNYKGKKPIPQEIYDNLFHKFNPEKFNAEEWVDVFKKSGVGYIVFTTKHHDGFCMFDSKYTDYDIMNTPFGRDISKELSDACHKAGIKVIWYYSKADWYDTRYDVDNPKQYQEYMLNQVDELSSNYGEIKGFWWDGGEIYIDGAKAISLIHKNQPGAIYNNRGPNGIPGLAFATPEQKLGGFNKERPWETCAVMQGEGWFWNGGKNIKSIKTCLRLLIDSAIGDGNLLLDFGPKSDGTIYEPIKKNFLEMGEWLKVYGESIYGTRGGPYKPAGWGGATHKGNKIYLHVTQNWTDGNLVLPALPTKILRVSTFGEGVPTFKQTNEAVVIKLDKKYHEDVDTVIVLEIDSAASAIIPIDYFEENKISLDATAKASSEKIVTYKGYAGSVTLQYLELGFAEKLAYGERGDVQVVKKVKKPHKKFKASKEELKKHPWMKLHRGHVWRFWMAKANDKQPWIEIDLDKEKEFSRVSIVEKFSRVKSHEIQYFNKNEWITCAKGGELGVVSYKLSKPIKSQKVRLVIKDWESDIKGEGPAIHSIDLY